MRMARHFRLMAGACLLVVLGLAAACETTVTRPEFEDLSFAHQPPLAFNLADVQLVQAYRAPFKPPNVEHDFPTPPSVAVKRWVEDRIRAEGATGAIRITVRNASAVMTRLATNTDIEGLVTTEQAERLDVKLDVLFEIMKDGEPTGTFASVQVTRSRTLDEAINLNERDAIYFAVTKELMNDFNATSEQNIRQYFSKSLR